MPNFSNLKKLSHSIINKSPKKDSSAVDVKDIGHDSANYRNSLEKKEDHRHIEIEKDLSSINSSKDDLSKTEDSKNPSSGIFMSYGFDEYAQVSATGSLPPPSIPLKLKSFKSKLNNENK